MRFQPMTVTPLPSDRNFQSYGVVEAPVIQSTGPSDHTVTCQAFWLFIDRELQEVRHRYSHLSGLSDKRMDATCSRVNGSQRPPKAMRSSK